MNREKETTFMLDRLANPPLVEVICEFRFDPTQASWDWTVPGRLYERVKEEFPRREQVGEGRYPLWAGEYEGPFSAGGVVDRVRLGSEDGVVTIHLSPYQMFVNHLYPYPGWTRLSCLILGVLEKYLEVASPTTFAQVGLRYINQIPLPLEAEVDIGSFITLDPPIPPKLARVLADFYQRYELLYDNPRGVLLHHTGLEVDVSEPRQYLTLDLDFVSLQNPDFGAPGVASWLDAAHDRIEEAFLASIATELLDKMRREER